MGAQKILQILYNYLAAPARRCGTMIVEVLTVRITFYFATAEDAEAFRNATSKARLNICMSNHGYVTDMRPSQPEFINERCWEVVISDEVTE